MTRTASITRPCTARLLHTAEDIPSGETAPLTPRSRVTYLHHGADQDGWDGHIIVSLDTGRIAAVEPECIILS